MEKKKAQKVRLNKYIASCGFCSRRKADESIEAGKVRVNGEVITELGFAVSTKDRVMVHNKIVKPEQIDDSQAMFLAKDIAKKIESELEYPGQIKVNVIREWRCVEYAK